MSDYVVYEETTGWPWWVAAIIVVSSVSGALGLLVGGGGAPTLFLGAGLIALLPLGIWFLFGKLVVRVTRTSVLVAFGTASLIQKLVAFSDIRRVEPVTYSPILEFGGWGIRWSFRGRKRAWTIRGNRAVVLHLRDGSRLYVGSEQPERLAEHIRQAAPGRFETGAT